MKDPQGTPIAVVACILSAIALLSLVLLTPRGTFGTSNHVTGVHPETLQRPDARAATPVSAEKSDAGLPDARREFVSAWAKLWSSAFKRTGGCHDIAELLPQLKRFYSGGYIVDVGANVGATTMQVPECPGAVLRFGVLKDCGPREWSTSSAPAGERMPLTAFVTYPTSPFCQHGFVETTATPL